MHNCICALIFFHGFISILGIKFCPPCEEWPDRAKQLQCRSQNKVFVCMLDDSNQILEKCIDDHFIKNGIGGCPFINVRKSDPDSVVIPHRDAYHKCPEEVTGCPPKNHGGYNLSEICKYPGCTQGSPRYTDITPNAHNNASSNTTVSYVIYEIKKDKVEPIILSVLGSGLSIIVVVVACIIVYKRKQKRRVDKGKLSSHKQSKYKGIDSQVIHDHVENHGDKASVLEYKDDDVDNPHTGACSIEYKDDDVDNPHTGACSIAVFEESNIQCQDANDKNITVHVQKPIVSGQRFEIKKHHQQILERLENSLFGCEYSEFERQMSIYYGGIDNDLTCHLDCLKIHGDIFKGNLNNLEANFEGLMNHCARSSNPLYFQVKLLSARSRLYVNIKEKDKLKDNITIISGKIAIDPSIFGGCLAGWLSFDKCRYYKEEIRQIQESDEEANEKVARFTHQAEIDLTAAIELFKNDKSPESMHCTGIAMLEMVTIKSKWFGKTLTQNLHPEKYDLIQCKNLLHEVEFSGVSLLTDVELNIQFLKSKCIYAFQMEATELARYCWSSLRELVKKHNRGGVLAEVEALRECLEGCSGT